LPIFSMAKFFRRAASKTFERFPITDNQHSLGGPSFQLPPQCPTTTVFPMG
jgi:hypothetical protein